MLILYILLFTLTVSCSPHNKANTYTFKEKTIQETPEKSKIQEVVYIDGITLRHFNFINNQKIIKCHPNEKVKFSLIYDVDTEKLPSFHLHHLLIGLDSFSHTNSKELDKRVGPQQILLTNLGFFDEQGKKESTLTAPREKGKYLVRFAHGKGITFNQAQQEWLREGPEPKSVMGILIVE